MMSKKSIVFLLKLTCFCVFIGRAYEHLFWDAPFRSLLWDQKLLSPIVEGVFNTSWRDYVTSSAADSIIQNIMKINGAFYAICAIVSLLIKENSKKIFKVILFTGGVFLFLLALMLTKSKFYHISMFFEHSIQFGAPFVLLYLFKEKQDVAKLIMPLKVITALAFISHGVYAIGTVYPLPGNFVTMTLNILPITENLAKSLLYIAGILDFVVAILIFIPKISRAALIYAAFWGIVTAFARVVNGLTYDMSFLSLHQYLFATMYRIPHGLIPLVCFMILTYIKRKEPMVSVFNSHYGLGKSNNMKKEALQ